MAADGHCDLLADACPNKVPHACASQIVKDQAIVNLGAVFPFRDLAEPSFNTSSSPGLPELAQGRAIAENEDRICLLPQYL